VKLESEKLLQEIERRLTELSRYSKKLALIQRKIDLEIERET
jgi:hypothetical protein